LGVSGAEGDARGGAATKRCTACFSGVDEYMITHIPPAPRTKAASINNGVENSDQRASCFPFLD